MNPDEQAIRDLIQTWMRASAAGDTAKVLSLMTEDAVFLVAGREPMRGRAQFAAAAAGNPMRMEGQSEVQEVVVRGDLGYCWTRLRVSATPAQGGAPMRRSGHTLTILRKQADGSWLLARDANLLAPDPA